MGIDIEPVRHQQQESGGIKNNSLAENQTETSTAINRIQACPISYPQWLNDLNDPSQLTNLRKAETEISKSPRIKEITTSGTSLGEALLTLHIPQLESGQREAIMASPTFATKILPLLTLFEYRFIKRIPGIVYLLEEAGKTQDPSHRFAGEKHYEGTVIKIDIANFSGRTRTEGAEKTTAALEANFYPDLFDTLRRYPEIKFIKTIGDEVVLISENATDTEIDAFTKAFAQRTKRKGFGTHTGIAKGHFGITITPSGKVIINGPASTEATTQQKRSKTKERSGEEIPCGIFKAESELTFDETEDIPLPPAPKISAMHLLKGFNPTTINELASDPEMLERELRSEMAMLASTVTQYAIRNENPIERRATAVAITAKSNTEATGENIIAWEEKIERIAQKYGGTVIYLDLTEDKKEAIVAFGAQGSSPLFQEERSARFANEVTKLEDECKIGIESGSIYMSDTGRAGAISDAVNQAVRLANAGDISGMIRIGPSITEKFGDNVRPEVLETRSITLKHIGEKTVTVCDNIEFPTEEKGYVRALNAKEIVAHLTDGKNHINIVGDPGMGQAEILEESARILETEHGFAVVRMGQHHEKHTTYGCIRKIIKTIFPEIEDFESWMEKTDIEESEQTLWRNLYEELINGSTKTSILNSKETATRELTTLLSKTENLCITCENVDSSDPTSQEILVASKTKLITTDGKNGTRYDLHGISIAVATGKVALQRLHLPENTDTTIERGRFVRKLGRYLRSRLPMSHGTYSLLAVQLEIEDLIRRGVIKEGEWEFDNSKLDINRRTSESTSTFLEDLATHQLDQVETSAHEAIPTLKTAALLGECKQEEIIDIIGPADWRSQKTKLVQLGILATGKGIRFINPFLARVQRPRTLQHQKSEAEEIELNMRKYLGVEEESFPITRYLDICGKMGIVLSPDVAQATADYARTCLSQNKILACNDACRQFLELTGEPSETEQMRNILPIYLNLIRSQITLGTDSDETIQKAEKLLQGNVDVATKRELTDLKFKAASRKKNPENMDASLREMEALGTDKNTILLRKSELYLVASGKAEKREDAIRLAEEGIKTLKEAKESEEKNKLTLQLQGFLYGFLRRPNETPNGELDHCVESIEDSSPEKTDEDLRTMLYAVAILFNRNQDKDNERATNLATRVKKDGKENGLMAIVTNAINCEMNLAIQRASNYQDQEAYGQLESVRYLYEESITYQNREDLQPLKREFTAIVLTAYEAAVNQLEIIVNNPSDIQLGAQLTAITAYIKKIKKNLEIYQDILAIHAYKACLEALDGKMTSLTAES